MRSRDSRRRAEQPPSSLVYVAGVWFRVRRVNPGALRHLNAKQSFVSAALATALLSFASGAAAASPATGLVRIFVVAGQSNAVGAGAAAAQLPPYWYAPQPDVRLWFEIGPAESVANPAMRVSSSGNFVPLCFQTDASGRTFGSSIHGFGPELRLGRTLADSLDDDIAIVKFAFNATDLAGDWNSDLPGNLCGQMIRRVRAARAALAASGQASRVDGLFWMQGESDAANSDDAWRYAERLTKLIVRVRTDLEQPTLPVVIGRVNVHIDSSVAYSLPYVNVIRAQQAFVAANVPYTALVDTDDLALTSDGLHFDAKSELDLGLRFAAEHLALTHEAPGTGFCFGDSACPCGNASTRVSHSGCTNSLARGGKLLASGTARMSDDHLLLALVGLPAGSAAQFVEHGAQHNGGFGTPMGDGLRCLNGRVVRLGMKTGNAVYPGTGDTPIHSRGMARAGRTLYYQVLYRDDASFCTPSLSNSTNALAITWGL